MPVPAIVSQAFRSKLTAPPRCKLIRSAVASYVRSRWGPGASGELWAPTAATYDPVRSQVEALLRHRMWERVEVIGSLLHLAVLRHEAATTVDLAVRFEGGGLGLLAVWSGPDEAIHPLAPWAELGAAVAAVSDRGLTTARVGVIWAGETGVKVEAKGPDEALGLWVDATDLARRLRSMGLQSAA